MHDLRLFHPRAVVFDLDGTIVDNMPWHAEAFDLFVRRHGLPPMSMDLRRRTDGKRNSEIFPMLFGRDLTPTELRACGDEKEGAYREISRGRLRPMPGLVRLLDQLGTAGIRTAVATSAPSENVVHTLTETGLAGRFDAVARGDQVPRGKPEPDVFLLAASLLAVDPATCLAFEDAPLGVTAARRAGMRCVAMSTTFEADVFLASAPPPDAICADFDEYLARAGTWLSAV